MELIKGHIENNQEKYIDVLFKLLKQPSISSQNIGMEECAKLLVTIMEDAGIKSNMIETKGHPIVYGEIINPENEFTILFYGHYDVQPPDPYEKWISNPFEPEIRNGKIYARGAGDNKGQLLAHILAIKSILEIYGKLPINVKLIFDGEEENLSENFAPFVEEHRDLLQADLVYTADGPLHNSGLPIITLGCRGMLYIELTAKGANKDHHSGNKGGIVPNPAWQLIHALTTMYSSNGEVLIEGFYDDVKSPTKYEQELLQSLPFSAQEIASLLGIKTLDLDGYSYYNRLTFQPTFNISGLTSGYGGEGSKTIIPSVAKVKLDLRLAADQDPDDIYHKIENHIKKNQLQVEMVCHGKVKPSRTSPDNHLVQKVIGSVEKIHQKKPLIIPAIGATYPDYVFTQILGLPSILVPYANADEDNHSPNENLDISCFTNGIKTSSQVILDLGNKQP